MPITYQEMLSFFQLEQIYPEPYEITLIKEFDKVFMNVQAEELKKEQKKTERQNRR